MLFQHFGKDKDGVTEVQGELNAIILSAGGEVMHEEKWWEGSFKWKYSTYPARQVGLLLYFKNVCSVHGNSGITDFKHVVEFLISGYKGFVNGYA